MTGYVVESESDSDFVGPPAPMPQASIQAQRLYGLRYVLDAHNLRRKALARDLDIDFRRFYAIVSVNVRAESDEIRRLMETLKVSLADLITVPENAPPPKIRSRRAKTDTFEDDDEAELPSQQSLPPGSLDADAESETVSPDVTPEPEAIAQMTNHVSAEVQTMSGKHTMLTIHLPDGRQFTLTSNQPLSYRTLARMSRALAVMIGLGG